MHFDFVTLFISFIGVICTFISSLVSYIAKNERKIIVNKFKGLVALVQINDTKTDMIINALSQIKNNENIGDQFKNNYDWMYKQNEARINEFERQSASIQMDI